MALSFDSNGEAVAADAIRKALITYSVHDGRLIRKLVSAFQVVGQTEGISGHVQFRVSTADQEWFLVDGEITKGEFHMSSVKAIERGT